MVKLMHLQPDHALWYEVEGCLLEKFKNCMLRTKVYNSAPFSEERLGKLLKYRWVNWRWVVSSLWSAAPAQRLGVGSSGHVSGRQASVFSSSLLMQLTSPQSSCCSCQVSSLTTRVPLLIQWRESRDDSLQLQY